MRRRRRDTFVSVPWYAGGILIYADVSMNCDVSMIPLATGRSICSNDTLSYGSVRDCGADETCGLVDAVSRLLPTPFLLSHGTLDLFQ